MSELEQNKTAEDRERIAGMAATVIKKRFRGLLYSRQKLSYRPPPFKSRWKN
jgi:hypothetical protein